MEGGPRSPSSSAHDSAPLGGTVTLYELLDCTLAASPDQLKRQFRRLALLYHPDKAGCSERFLAIRSAFEVLKDPAKRFKYDTTLLHMLDMQEYLSRFSELVLTVQGLSLPPHLAHLHSTSATVQQQQQQQQRQPYRTALRCARIAACP
ncbi:hypothetical protein CHLNCDRAFT_53215 [Chlorella variabilis]|uniref:J domain-containing protein n=1 Tax=Chlorella variabilis TaxID=554065 RepID=E1ZIT8_CHLVA|nr:hypothetical protein CHLNCDRAFT_53215 [Chlorella variabilis]EFN54391.1 hypothetical protein CHLNCDRAFT_53215 [Chlorella variabilis]|eukprot:XP_005846493.1 hypothetical protein CHLNCDRAFT_53215 [Chlorella variabilis]